MSKKNKTTINVNPKKAKKTCKIKKSMSDYNELRIKKSGFLNAVIKYFKKYPLLYIIAILTTIASSVISVIIPKITIVF